MSERDTSSHPHTLRARIRRWEGRRLRPYRDTAGRLTVGYGHLLERPYTEMEIERFLDVDIAQASREARRIVQDLGLSAGRPINGLAADVSPERFEVLIDMCFNIGEHGVRGFHDMMGALARRDWSAAADAMLDSEYARTEVGRAHFNAAVMRTGHYPKETTT